MKDNSEDARSSNPIVKWISDSKNVALALIAVVTAFTAWQNQQAKAILDQRLGNLEAQNKEFEQLAGQIRLEIDKKKFSNDQLFQLYREIKESINQKNCDQQLLLTMIVDQIMAENVTMRDSLRGFITKHSPDCAASKYIEQQTKAEKVFKNEQTQVEAPSGFTIDVFYLDDIPQEAVPRADRIKDLLTRKYPNYLVRKRLLPKSVNARTGYNIGRNEIRFEQDEGLIAKEIYDAIVEARVFNLEQPELHTITYQTPNYLSIFVRNM